eukprot:m.74321 g.74321  ORF g.74321 m.74321 type:complete len:54 (+) comp18890_c0_seq1:948-1109(+)
MRRHPHTTSQDRADHKSDSPHSKPECASPGCLKLPGFALSQTFDATPFASTPP